jgi:SAM-dependent methyltransferase
MTGDLSPEADRDLTVLLEAIRRDRFHPEPPPSLHFCGDGNFRAIGAEFLGHFVRIGGLTPQAGVLDLGCGIGRMAVPLTQYLADGAVYDGVDIVEPGIAWCTREITARYANFRFHRLDIQHPLYNPQGVERQQDCRLPFADGSKDFVIATSLMTHLAADEMAHYAREIRRVLAPGGRAFITFFLMNPAARGHLERNKSGAGARLPFDPAAPGTEFHAFADRPTAAVAFDEDFMISTFEQAGLTRVARTVYGHWCGRSSPVYQDIAVFGPVQADIDTTGDGDRR